MSTPPLPMSVSQLDKVIAEALSQLEAVPAYSDEYIKIVTQIERLTALKTNDRRRQSVSPDTLAIVLGNLAGILIIISHERVNVITTKALGFVMKASR